MKDSWERRRLRDVTTKIGSGATPLGGEAAYKAAGISLIRSMNVYDDGFRTKDLAFLDEEQAARLNNVIVESGDVLLNITGASVARCCLVPNDLLPARVNQHVSIVRPMKHRLLPECLHYMLISRDYKNRLLAVGEDGGSTRQAITKAQIQEFEIELPPLPEQRRIVGILDEAFKGVAAAKTNAEKNRQNARAIFESHREAIFGQRGPGYIERKLSEICAITSILVDPRERAFLDLIHVGAGNIESKTGQLVELKTAKEEKLISGKFPFDESMVLYSKIRPYLMKVARPEFAGLCSADMYPLAPSNNAVTRDYLFHLLLSNRFTRYAMEGSARAGMPKVNRGHLFGFKAWVPPVKIQQAQSATLDALQERTQRLAGIYERKLAALEDLTKSLLERAFAGELTANRTSELVEAVA